MSVLRCGYYIDKAIFELYQLGFEQENDVVFDSTRQIHICFLQGNGYRIELVSPAGEQSVVAGLIRKVKNTPYHLCYESQNLEEDIKRLTVTDGNFMVLHEPASAPAIEGRRVVFLFSKVLGLIELVDMEKRP